VSTTFTYAKQPHELLNALTHKEMASKGWFNLEAVGGTIPETQFFEGDSAFKFLGLTRTQRLYGFVAWCAVQALVVEGVT
jgi:hypothetical protein